MAALVVADHPRKGQICKILYHDWNDSRDVGVESSDGHVEDFYDGMIE